MLESLTYSAPLSLQEEADVKIPDPTQEEGNPEPLSVSEAAAAKVWDLIKEEGNPEPKLRVYVTGGGCSGLQYGFTFDETIQADDAVVSKTLQSSQEEPQPLVRVLVDSLSLDYLRGAEIDYKNDLEGEQFIIRNPNAKTTCGCGSSFTAE